MKHKLTVIIPCYNEARHMKALLESVAWADEVFIVDSFSTDETLDIARKYDTRIVQHAYENSARQKNWAIPQATHEWILLVDADERVTPELRAEIEAILNQERPDCAAYWIGRVNHFLGKKVRYSGWQGDAVIRLFKRDNCRYEDKAVHAEVVTNGKVGRLKNKLLHFTYRDIDHFLTKMQRYAAWSAKDYTAKTPKVTYFHLYIKPLARFVKHFFVQKGFRDGKTGFIISVIMAWGVFLRYVKLLERTKIESKS